MFAGLRSASSVERRERPLRRRLREPDRFGILLILIVLTMFGIVLGGTSMLGTAIATGLAATVLVFALRTSAAPRRLVRAMAMLAPLLAVAAVLARTASARVADITAPIATTLLVLGALIAVAKRLLSHPAIGASTILGAVCVYLLLGLMFASVYGCFGAAGRVFAQQATATAVEDVYFSFITLATVGYGDLTPGTDLLRIIAVVEALAGQLYLVTVIAVLVGNMGSSRQRGPAV